MLKTAVVNLSIMYGYIYRYIQISICTMTYSAGDSLRYTTLLSVTRATNACHHSIIIIILPLHLFKILDMHIHSGQFTSFVNSQIIAHFYHCRSYCHR